MNMQDHPLTSFYSQWTGKNSLWILDGLSTHYKASLHVDVLSDVQEWWRTESLPDFLRKWNPIIQEWLKAYVYRPLRSIGLPAGAAMLVILVLSAFEHDFLLSAGLGYFMPVYIVEYGICGK